MDPNDRPELMELYLFYKAKKVNDQDPEWARHWYMTENFVIPIAEAIRQLDNYQYPLDHYMAFGWDGLAGYGFNGYYVGQDFVQLGTQEHNDLVLKQAEVKQTTNFGNDCPD